MVIILFVVLIVYVCVNSLIAAAVKPVRCCSLTVFLLSYYVHSLQKKLPYLQFQLEAYDSGGIFGCGIGFLRLMQVAVQARNFLDGWRTAQRRL